MDKIGDFAKRCQTTIKTLRFYDQLGLLTPDYIDTFSGYRYYGLEKVVEMRRIVELKEIGLTLEEIKKYCKALTNEERNRIIDAKQESLVKQAEDTARQLEKLEAIKRNLLKEVKKMTIDVNASFENDERVIGRWEFIATVPSKDYFKPDNQYDNETIFEELYFLPDGEPYWGFGWTKGFVKITFGDGIIIPYELDEVDGKTFMFLDHPSCGLVWVLKQTDKERHTLSSIAKQDNVDLPFVDDPQIHGKWSSIDYVDRIEDFNPEKQQTALHNIGMKAVEFYPDGVFEWTWQDKYAHHFTKGTALITWWNNGKITHTTAPAYEIRVINNMEYLFFEHKSGDYTWGKMNPGYFIMCRNTPESQTNIHFNMPFENDESMIGRWETVAVLNEKDDFIPSKMYDNDSYPNEVYFLPQGKGYWVFSWTKGYLKINGGDDNKLCLYTFEEINGERYIFVEYKNDCGFKPMWVLRQTDNHSYTDYEIGQWDDINLPFIDDPVVHGIWISVDFVSEIETFNPANASIDFDLWLKSMEFLPNGQVRKLQGDYEHLPQSKWKDHMNTVGWTKGRLLESFCNGSIAPAYTIRRIDDIDYLFFEWKSGDYVWGKVKPKYYVLKRESQ